MLTVHEHKVIPKVLVILCASYCVPLDWNESKEKLSFTKSKIKLVILHFICMWELIYVLYVGLSLFQFHFGLHFCGNGSTEQLVFQVAAFTSVSIFMTEYITMILYGKDLCNLFNEMSHFNQKQGK